MTTDVFWRNRPTSRFIILRSGKEYEVSASAAKAAVICSSLSVLSKYTRIASDGCDGSMRRNSDVEKKYKAFMIVGFILLRKF